MIQQLDLCEVGSAHKRPHALPPRPLTYNHLDGHGSRHFHLNTPFPQPPFAHKLYTNIVLLLWIEN